MDSVSTRVISDGARCRVVTTETDATPLETYQESSRRVPNVTLEIHKSPDAVPATGSPWMSEHPVSRPSGVMASATSRLFEVVLRGGRPWGFTLSGGSETNSSLFVAAIEPGGKAARCQHLQVRDQIISVNDVSVLSHHDAVQIICSSFGTLTLAVKRGHTSGPASGPPAANHEAVFIRRQDTPDRSQDDSSVFTESKAKDGATRRPKRRGASFNLRSTTRTSSWTQPPGDSDAASKDDTTHYDRGRHSTSSVPEHPVDRRGGSFSSADRVRRMYTHKSTPSLQDYTDESLEHGTPPGVVPPSQSWHSSMTSVSAGGASSHGMPSSENTHEKRSRMKKSSSYSHTPSQGPAHWDVVSQPYRNQDHLNMDNKENRPNRGQSDMDIRHGYSASYSGPTSVPGWKRAHSASHIRNYENMDNYSSSHGDIRYAGDTSNYNSDNSMASAGMSGTVQTNQRSVSPPMPPVRDASSLRYGKVNQSHEKYPSWPVTQATAAMTTNSTMDHGMTRGINSRTNSWSDSSYTSSEFPNKPRMAYQPQLNTHPEERMSPQTMKRYLEENRIRSPKEEFNERVARELRGVDVDIKKDFPLDSKGKLDMNSMKGSDLSYPLPQLDKDGRYKEDKNYAIPSPPQRDNSPIHHYTESSNNTSYSPGQYSVNNNVSTKSMDYYNNHYNRDSNSGAHPVVPESTTPPFPVPPVQPLGSAETSLTDSGIHSVNTSHDRSSKPSPQQAVSNYPYIIRNRAFYNTSTQTDSKSVETQADPVDQTKSTARIRREEKSVQARPGSIVGHQNQKHSEDSDYERLIFNREANVSSGQSVGVGTSDMGTSPGPYSPRDHNRLADHADHHSRIPKTIRENEEHISSKPAENIVNVSCNDSKTFTENVIAQIREHSEDETVMLRRLSKDFFPGQSQYGTNNNQSSRMNAPSQHNATSRVVTDVAPHSRQASLSQQGKVIPEDASMRKYTHRREKSEPAALRSRGLTNSHAPEPVVSQNRSISHRQDPQGQMDFQPKVTSQQEQVSAAGDEDMISDLPKISKDQNQYFDRNKTANMSLRKAYGIFEEIDVDKPKQRLFGPNSSAIQSRKAADGLAPKKSGKKKSKKSPENGTRETKIIAEKARKDWEKSGKLRTQDQGLGQLKRTTSEQLRPMKERLKDTEKYGSDRYPANGESKVVKPENRRRSADPKSKQIDPVAALFAHQRHTPQEPSEVQKVEEFLCNSPLSRQRRMASESDSPALVSPSHVRQSSGSTEEHSRNSDPELKKFQQHALLNFFEKKTGKRKISGGAEVSPAEFRSSPPSSPSRQRWDHDYQNITQKSASLPQNATPTYQAHTASGSSQSTHRTSQEVTNPGTEDMEDMPSPPLLDTTKDLSPAKPGAAPFKFSPEYSPPPHPWRETDKPTWSGITHSPEGTTVSPTLPANKIEPAKSQPEETHPKAIEANISSSTSGTVSHTSGEGTNQKYAYQITVNKNYSPKEEDDKPPVLPPRNYRGGSDRNKGRPSLPEPAPSVERESNNNHKHVSQVNVRFTNDFDATPKEDSYAAQLRQQSRRISQSQSSLLNAARYQNKSLPETKTSISTSRPVDKPPTPQEAKVPLPGHRIGGDTVQDWMDRNPLDNIRATTGPVGPLVAHSANNSFDSSGPVKSPRNSTGAPPSPRAESKVEELKSPKDKVNMWDNDASQHKIARPQHLHSSFDNIMNSPPPPPPPPKNISSPDRRLEDKPLPPPPPEILDIQEAPSDGLDSDITTTPTSRYSADSYLYNRGSTRQGFGGNYRRSGEVSPAKPLTPGGSTSQPPYRQQETIQSPGSTSYTPYRQQETIQSPGSSTSHTPYRQETIQSPGSSTIHTPYRQETIQALEGSTSYIPYREETGHSPGGSIAVDDMKHVSVSDQAPLSPLRQNNKPYMEPPWGKRTFYPANKSPTEPQRDAAKHPSHITTPPTVQTPDKVARSNNSFVSIKQDEEQEGVESPSVRACIANFENWSPRTQRKFGQSAVTRTKVMNMRDTFVRKSNENLHEMSDLTLDQEHDSVSSHSRSNESLEEKLSTSKSTENLNKTTVSPNRDKIIPPAAPTKISDPCLTLNLDLKPVSPTLESGYNSHTPDNRSIISELSLSSGSASNPSRHGSTVSKDSMDIPTSHSVTVVHVRQKSMEEIECDKQAAIVVSRLPDTEKQQLSEVILPPPQHKTTTDYMSGIFDTRVDVTRKPSLGTSSHNKQQSMDSDTKEDTLPGLELDLPVSSAYWSPPSIAQLQNRMRQEGLRTEDLLKQSGASLQTQKEELVTRIEKKMSILNEEKASLDKEIEENNNLGTQVIHLVEEKASSCHDFNKFKIYLEELDTVLKLLLKVSRQLARAENAVMSLPEGADSKEKGTLLMKRDDLSQKHEDAKQLKEGIDLRSRQVSSQLSKCLTSDEFHDYEYFIKMKSKLKMEQQEIEDKISLGKEQLMALRKSLPS